MSKITEKGLNKNLGAKVRIEREGIVGNIKNKDGVIKKGSLLGKLLKDGGGFYVEMFTTYWRGGFGLVVDENYFMDIPYRLQNGDVVNISYPSCGVKSYIVAIPYFLPSRSR